MPGPNPRYPARPSYHPILARIAETETVLGAPLRPGDTSLGARDVEDVEQWLARAHAAAPEAVITVRIDAGDDCAALLNAIDRQGAYFVVKARLTPNLVSPRWGGHVEDLAIRGQGEIDAEPRERRAVERHEVAHRRA